MYDKYMSQVSKRRIEPEIENELIDSLSYTIKELKTKKEADRFLASALTKTERLMISKRLLTAYLLKNNIEEIKIGQTLKLTNATITRLKMWISLHKDGFDLVLTKLNKKSAEDTAKQILQKILRYAIESAFGRTPNPFKTR